MAHAVDSGMSTILELSVDSEDFALGRTLDTGVDATVSLEEVIPTDDRTIPYFWASSENLQEFERSLEDDPSVESVRRHLRLSGSALYYAQWTEEVRSLLYSIADEEGTILDGVGSVGRWQFTLRFPDRDSVAGFRRRCAAFDISLDVGRVYSASADGFDAEYGLTEKQREILVTALENGYFRVPRDCSQQELAEKLGIQSSAASETLRRATAELIANSLLETEVR